ncbi:UNKNOWN [Stylonychia lemnae]|uniref:Uncharacterized protein n=1 Tax=Stylonychia lemnae TaxID=5949 RepID=A0A078AX41_STYLE|nr:UNKNOWN [Stylonychia lemnae]|eukprot:CDW87010.1 UNKNOWN [Stylonychia lemnae]
MDIQFDQLISTSIKRLTRPKFKHEFTTFYDQKQFQAIPLIGQQLDEQLHEANQEMMNSNDITCDGIDIDSAINYNPSFGKICTGEQFRVLFTLMNTNTQYSIENIKMKVVVQRQSLNQQAPQGTQSMTQKPKEEVLMHEVIKSIPAKSQIGFIFMFKVDFQDNYFILMKVVDVNNHVVSGLDDNDIVSIFNESIAFNPGEIRQYLFIIQHKDTAHKINKFEMYQLGQLELRWVNYFGDAGLLKIGPFKYNAEQKTKFEIDLDVISDDQILKLEEPKTIMFRLYNLSANVMKIQLSVKEKEVGDLLIYFGLDLFPKSCGVHPVCGLLIKDQASGREWIFKNVGEFLVEYE